MPHKLSNGVRELETRAVGMETDLKLWRDWAIDSLRRKGANPDSVRFLSDYQLRELLMGFYA